MGTLHKCVCINQCPAFLYGTGATPLISRLRQVTMVTLVAERSLTQTPYRLASSYHAWKNATSGIFGEINPALKTNTRPQKMDICSSLPGHVRLKNTLTKPREMFGSSSGSQPTVGAGESQSGSSITQQTNPETFGNYQLAYSSKSVAELLRMLSFFFLCRFSFFTEHAIKIMEFSYKVLGRRLAEFLIRKSVYDQFVAGETTNEVQVAALRLRRGGVASILCVPMETDDQSGSSTEAFFDANLDKVISSIQLATQIGDRFPMTQFRISALLAGDLTKKISSFCAQTIHNPEVMKSLKGAMFGNQVNFSRLPGWEEFPHARAEELMKGLQRLGKIKEALENQDVIVLIDAEYTYLNPTLRLLALCLMEVCNTELAKVFYTYQAYLKATRKNLEEDLNYALTSGFEFGLKLVRGAYMVTERRLACELGYEDPVNETFDLTSASYHSCLDFLLEQLVKRQSLSLRFVIASHNEDTVRYAMTRMNALGIPKDGASIFFAQLYGMADHVSFTLGHNGYRVYKSVPYGPVWETLPYLARRAQENKAILANSRRERKLVTRALADRIMLKK